MKIPAPPEKHALLFGKKKAKVDRRTVSLRSVMRAPVAIPPEFHVDARCPGSPIDALGNTQYGCCVISARGHQTRRFELYETKKLVKLTAQDVVNEYFRESGGQDSGLSMLDSLKQWRRGWLVGGAKYSIYGFLSIERGDNEGLKQAMFARLGGQIGVRLPKSAMRAIDAGKPWTDTTQSPMPNGGHCIYLEGYSPDGLTCITWGIKQFLTWKWLAKYCDERYAIIDAIDAKTARLIHKGKFDEQLAKSA